MGLLGKTYAHVYPEDVTPISFYALPVLVRYIVSSVIDRVMWPGERRPKRIGRPTCFRQRVRERFKTSDVFAENVFIRTPVDVSPAPRPYCVRFATRTQHAFSFSSSAITTVNGFSPLPSARFRHTHFLRNTPNCSKSHSVASRLTATFFRVLCAFLVYYNRTFIREI